MRAPCPRVTPQTVTASAAQVDPGGGACEHLFVFREATILHADVDSFFASVEQRDDPRLRGRPVIVGPGVVMAASYEARARGVRSAMGAAQARRLCPDAVVVAPRFSAYAEAGRDLFEVFRGAAPVVEGLSMEEAFLEVRGLRRIAGTPLAIAVRLRRDVRRRVGLPVTVGIASTRPLAKVASGIAKPDGLLLVREGHEHAFLRPLPVERLWGVGASTATKLQRAGIATVGDLAGVTETELIELLGRASGRSVLALANNRDPRPLRPRRRRRSVGSQHALGRAPRSPESLDAVLVSLVDRVTRRLRAGGAAGRTVVLRLRFADFSRATRSHTLAQPSATTATILAAARALLAAALPVIARRGVTLLGITVTNLGSGAGGVQLELPFARSASLDAAVDELRSRYGAGVVTRGSLVGRGARLAPSLMPGDRSDR